MDRTAYKNRHIKEHYDRINLVIPKGEKDRIKNVCSEMGASVNEYLYMLVCNDLAGGTSRMAAKKQAFNEEQEQMLDKWQIAEKYRKMIESMDIEEINGMNKYYTILADYGKYGVTKEKLQPMIEDGIKRDLSLQTIYNGLRMSLASAFGEHEYFTLDDVMEITGESREELLQRIEQCRQELVEAGKPGRLFQACRATEGSSLLLP